MKQFITTPIYYVNDVPHIGHAYTTVLADVLARYYRLIGDEVIFLTGTDEHGQKIQEAAKSRGKEPKEYADEVSAKFRALWDEFDITYDKYIRTTDEYHIKGVQKAFEVMFNKGDIYKGTYSGNYCVSCESFFTSTQLIDGSKCPDCGKETRIIEEESYFFKLSKYQDKLLEFHQNNPTSVIPKGKQNEVISFIKQGLNDLSVTRTSFDWGIKLPSNIKDEKHVMYVWLDALLNYITALGYGGDEENFSFWPASYHLVGKDILRFHAIYWPAFLMSLDLPLPKQIASHGWWTRDGEKMSKSKGNVINPKEVADAYGLDNFRYFMLREVSFGLDGDFSEKSLIDRINSDLGNELGNLLNRIIGMSEKYNDFKVTSKNLSFCHEKEILSVHEKLENVESLLTSLQTNRFLEELWKVLSFANQSITLYEPWTKMKEGKKDEALALIALVANILAKVTMLLSPIMPKTCAIIADNLGIKIDTKHYEKLIIKKEFLDDFVMKKIDPLFPRVENELLEKNDKEPKIEQIKIDEFYKTKIKVGTILECSKVPKSNKLLLFKIDLGEEKPRQVLSGIQEFYNPEELINTQVCVVSNLKPAKIMGLISEGMILSAENDGKLSLIRPHEKIKNGSVVG